MANLFGILNISDTQRAYVQNVGQQLVFDAVNTLLAQYNAEVSKQTAVFVEKTTEKFAMRYLLPGGGYLPKVGRMAPGPAVKRAGYWDVAFPLYEFGAQLAGDRVDLAYLTVGELQAHLDTILIQDLNQMRVQILTALFEDTNLTYADPINGSLTVRRLANTDGTVYPPVVGSTTEADDSHYRYTAYAIASIADANNPAVLARDELVEHFGGRQTLEGNVILFHNADATPYLEALTDYEEVGDRFVRMGVNANIPISLPNVPGRLHGRTNGVWLSEWAWIPATYALGVHLDAPAPLIRRIDPADTGLGQGLRLVAESNDYPLQGSHYSHRYGLGCGNRLSAVAVEISTDGSYAPPSAYAE